MLKKHASGIKNPNSSINHANFNDTSPITVGLIIGLPTIMIVLFFINSYIQPVQELEIYFQDYSENISHSMSSNIDDQIQTCIDQGGKWQLYNYSCADNCSQPNANTICQKTISRNCNCGKNKCWNGHQCKEQQQ